MTAALTGEVLELSDGVWRTVKLGNVDVDVHDRRRVTDPFRSRWLYATVTQPAATFRPTVF